MAKTKYFADFNIYYKYNIPTKIVGNLSKFTYIINYNHKTKKFKIHDNEYYIEELKFKLKAQARSFKMYYSWK